MNNLTSRKRINFKTDQGNEFVNSSLKEELENLGVVHDVSPKYHSSMNGTDGYKVLLIDSGLTADYWPYVAKCFTYLHNRQFSRVTPEAKTPFESMYLRKPQVDHLFEFGRLGAARSGKQQKKGKMKGRKAIFLGYKGREYLVYWLGTKKVGTARSGRFFKRVIENEAVSGKTHTEFSLIEPNGVDAETGALQKEEESETH
eukprot:maker-scaffold_17-snap-gene-6.66-mRNA-1 protein AED:0.30 eAED:0.32 QI:0/0/0/1/0/0/2/0/200